MITLTKLVKLASIALLACGATELDTHAGERVEVEHVYVSTGLTPAQLSGLHAAIREWNMAIGTSHRFILHDKPEAPRDQAVYVRAEPGLPCDGNGGCVLARAELCGYQVQVHPTRVDASNAKEVFMHELGHILCMGHISDIESALMHPTENPNNNPCVDNATLFYLAVVRQDLDFAGWKPTCRASAQSVSPVPASISPALF